MTNPPLPLFAIEAEGLTKSFRGFVAVDGLTLRVPRGSVFGFLGPNGAGKSTTIRMLMGLTKPTGGRAFLLGSEVRGKSHKAKARVGYVPESPSAYRWMRVREIIGFCRSFYDSWNDQLCEDLQNLFGLDGRKKVGTLSKGMLAKLGLLLAISHEPEVLILDEPTGGLDPLIREEFLDGVLEGICRKPQTILFSSHTLGDVQRLADSVGILHEGRLLVESPVPELLDSTKRLRAILRKEEEPRIPPPGTVWQKAEAREWNLTVNGYSEATMHFLRSRNAVEGVEVFDLTLEEIFKDFIKGQRRTA